MPQDALQSIKEFGLMSGSELVKHSTLFKLARPDKSDREEWLERYEEAKSNDDPFFDGIHILFTEPDFEKLHPEHFILKWKLRPVLIDYQSLLKDNPNLEVLGLELQPQHEDDKIENLNNREHYLSQDEILNYISMSPEELWQHHEGRVTHYASNVPHAIIMLPIIDSKYLTLM